VLRSFWAALEDSSDFDDQEDSEDDQYLEIKDSAIRDLDLVRT
jgi:hypothetical protein